MPMTSHPRTHAQSGFTMVVVAALFIAFAVIASVAVERNTTLQQITKRDAAREQLQRLSYAIIEYSVFNNNGTFNVYPCPARLDLADTSAAFGQSVHDGATPPVQNCSTVDHTGVINLPAGALSPVTRGMVPVQTLAQYGIGINDAFDPWNNRIMYVVNRQMTRSGTGAQGSNPTINYTLIDPTTPSGFNIRIPPPDFILISYGRDGVGGHKRTTASVTPTLACGGAATSLVFRLENCDVDDDFFAMPTYVAGDARGGDNWSAAPALNTYFDDILSWYRQ